MNTNLPESLLADLQEDDFLLSQLSVTETDYQDAVLRLVAIAQTDTSGARAAAQILLSLYNGNEYQVDLTDLCVLDYVNLNLVLIAIRGRVMLMKEPHEVIENGQRIFKDLSIQWSHLHVEQRFRK